MCYIENTWNGSGSQGAREPDEVGHLFFRVVWHQEQSGNHCNAFLDTNEPAAYLRVLPYPGRHQLVNEVQPVP